MYILRALVKSGIDWSSHRAVVFLDPFGTQVPWSTVAAACRRNSSRSSLISHLECQFRAYLRSQARSPRLDEPRSISSLVHRVSGIRSMGTVWASLN
jgi:hypothetical protein